MAPTIDAAGVVTVVVVAAVVMLCDMVGEIDWEKLPSGGRYSAVIWCVPPARAVVVNVAEPLLNGTIAIAGGDGAGEGLTVPSSNRI